MNIRRLKRNASLRLKPLTGGISETVLASLWRTIVHDMNIDGSKFLTLIDKYITRANLPCNLKDRSSIRGNIKKELESSRMSWKVFVKGLNLLCVTRFEIKLLIHMPSGNKREFSKEVNLVSGETNNENEDGKFY